jgi:hypothetical protein
MFERLAPRAEPKQPFPLFLGTGGPFSAVRASKPNNALWRKHRISPEAISSRQTQSFGSNPEPQYDSSRGVRCSFEVRRGRNH